MQILKLSGAIALAALMTACAVDNTEREMAAMGGFERASYALNTGQNDTAHEGFSCIASRGHGYEVAQHNAGLASLAMAEEPGRSQAEADELRQRGVEELTVAGRAGWPASQAALVEYYAGQGDDDALIMAGVWMWIYRSNNRETALGVQRLPEERRAYYAELVGEERLQTARERASTYRIEPMVERPASPLCAPWFQRGSIQIQVNRPAQQQRQQPQQQQQPGRQPGF
tara:strand:+ start:558 stop:1244 length:687 start_codon:yes stop_codon:yes gene_type:complete